MRHGTQQLINRLQLLAANAQLRGLVQTQQSFEAAIEKVTEDAEKSEAFFRAQGVPDNGPNAHPADIANAFFEGALNHIEDQYNRAVNQMPIKASDLTNLHNKLMAMDAELQKTKWMCEHTWSLINHIGQANPNILRDADFQKISQAEEQMRNRVRNQRAQLTLADLKMMNEAMMLFLKKHGVKVPFESNHANNPNNANRGKTMLEGLMNFASVLSNPNMAEQDVQNASQGLFITFVKLLLSVVAEGLGKMMGNNYKSQIGDLSEMLQKGFEMRYKQYHQAPAAECPEEQPTSGPVLRQRPALRGQ